MPSLGSAVMSWEGSAAQQTSNDKRARLLQVIAEKSLVLSQGEPFQLASGGTSTYLFDMKPTSMDPEGSNLIADLILEVLSTERCDYIGGLELGAVPIVSAVCVKSLFLRPISSFAVRKVAKDRGTKKQIEGNLAAGSYVVLLDDVTTTGSSVLQAVEAVRALGCHVNKVVTVVDRLEGAEENFARHGIELTALFDVTDFGITPPQS